jgi:TatA/E family protein of Tat protein translocase
MGPIGFPEMIFLFVLALLIFGPKKLPELGKSLGKGMAEFRRASNELKSTFQREMDNIERENQDVKTIANTVKKDINSSYYEDDQDYYSDYSNSSGSSESSATSASTASATNGSGVKTATAGAEPENENGIASGTVVSDNGVPAEAESAIHSPTAKAS